MSEKKELCDVVAMAALACGAEEFRRRAAVDDRLGEPFASASDAASAQLIAEAWQLALPESAMAASGAAVELLEFVTERIAVNDKDRIERANAAARHHYPLRQLELSPAIFGDGTNPEIPVNQQIADLWRKFKDDLGTCGGAGARFDSLLYLMQKYVWCIRSTTDGNRAAVSLYDHTRTAAAIAVCLHATRQENPEAEFLLIEAGISGIQQFIYSPTFNGQELQDGMARRLRGRSFYLNLLVKTLADTLTTELGLTSANTLWATGGHLLILAPNTAATRDRLATVRKQIQQWLWREYRGALGVVISDLAAKRDELKNFGQLRGRLEQISARQKLQLADLPLSFGDNAPDEAWENPWVLKMQDDICRDTGRDLSKDDLAISDAGQFVDDEEGERTARRSGQSLLFDAIGRALINARTIQLRRENEWLPEPQIARLPRNAKEAERLTESLNDVLIEFPGLSRTWLLTNQTPATTGAELCLRLGNHTNDKLDFLPGKLNPATGYGFELMATAVETEKDKKGRSRIKPFDKLAEQSDGAKYLGALRMDVDDLGFIFAQGLPEQERSIAKIANLSRMFDWFFAGHLNTLVDGKPLYTTYAGGDDLFVVGAWDEVLTLADTIQSDFKKFCGDNSALHISAGIALCRGKYPLGRAAEDAAAKLNDIAKTASDNPSYPNKSALAFLERKIPWEKWPDLLMLGDELIKAVEDKRVSRKFIYNLLTLYDQHIDPRRDPTEEKLAADLLWLPKFLYSLVRNVSDKGLCVSLQTSIPNNQDYLSVLAGYVLLKTRSRQTPSPASASGITQTEFTKELI